MSNNRAVFDRLPEKGYQDNPLVSALLTPYEERLSLSAERAGNFWKRLALTPLESEAVPVELPQVGGNYSLTKPTTLTLELKYPLAKQGLPQFARIMDVLSGGTVWERSFAGRAKHYFTGIKLPVGTYSVVSSEGMLSVREQTLAEKEQSDCLDYVAYLLGATGQYWSKQWDDGIKQNFIRSINNIQQWRGTEKGLRLVLDNQEVSYDLWGTGAALRLSFPVQSGYTLPYRAQGFIPDSAPFTDLTAPSSQNWGHRITLSKTTTLRIRNAFGATDLRPTRNIRIRLWNSATVITNYVVPTPQSNIELTIELPAGDYFIDSEVQNYPFRFYNTTVYPSVVNGDGYTYYRSLSYTNTVVPPFDDLFGSLELALVNGLTPTTFGSTQPNIFVRLPLTADRRSREFTESKRAVNNYVSNVSDVRVCYNSFYLGYSTVGEPIFK